MNHKPAANTAIALTTAMHRAPVTRRLVLLVTIVALYTGVVAMVSALGSEVSFHFEPDIHSFVGFVLGLLLVFRTNSAYDRWWEARKLWGQLVNDSRNLVVKTSRSIRVPEGDSQAICRLIVQFAHSLRDSLQDGSHKLPSIAGSKSMPPCGSPVEIVCQLYGRVNRWADDGQLDGFQAAALDIHLRSFLEVAGGCERIRRTRLSISYRAFVRQCIFLYLLFLPWCLVESYGLWAIPATIVVSYFMVGIELIAETVEQPFGSSDDHIPLNEICDRLVESIQDIVEPRSVLSERAA